MISCAAHAIIAFRGALAGDGINITPVTGALRWDARLSSEGSANDGCTLLGSTSTMHVKRLVAGDGTEIQTGPTALRIHCVTPVLIYVQPRDIVFASGDFVVRPKRTSPRNKTKVQVRVRGNYLRRHRNVCSVGARTGHARLDSERFRRWLLRGGNGRMAERRPIVGESHGIRRGAQALARKLVGRTISCL